METGTIKFFNMTKGFGFIHPDKEGADDVFVHITGLKVEGTILNEGDKVQYNVVEGKKGLQAVDVEKIEVEVEEEVAMTA